jgi:DNA-3-methyladenine glycosylase
MGISTSFNEANLDGDTIWLEEGGEANIEIGATTRIGVGYAGEDALKPWRFYSEGCKWVSKM